MHLSTRHVKVGKSGVRLYCSSECLDASLIGWRPPVEMPEPAPARDEVRPRAGRLLAIGLGIASLSPCGGPVDLGRRAAAPVVLPVSPVERPQPAPLVGPPAPTDEDRAREFLAELGSDRWLHPLPGPRRRMPIRDSRVFGASRDGNRPGECRSGHCGVDIGGEIWGEQVYAVHDGVVDRVKRVNEGRGGLYVRLAHRGGTVFTQYFHLAAIPRHLREGQKVRAGEVVGLVGDTGVQHSGAHLHFTISVKPSDDAGEIFMDPEPLIALWPLKMPREDGGAQAIWDPGVPRGAVGRPARRPRRPQRAERAARADAPAGEAAADAAAAVPAAAASVPEARLIPAIPGAGGGPGGAGAPAGGSR